MFEMYSFFFFFFYVIGPKSVVKKKKKMYIGYVTESRVVLSFHRFRESHCHMSQCYIFPTEESTET